MADLTRADVIKLTAIRIEGSILVAFEAGWFNVVAGGLSEVTKYLEV